MIEIPETSRTEPAGPLESTRIEGCFVFVDLAGYSAASWVHGDDTAAHLAMRLLELALDSRGAEDEVVKSMGDAVMCRTPDPASGLALVRRLWAAGDRVARFPQLRGALHHGNATAYRGDYFGTDVNISARLAALARADEILTTPRVSRAARTSGWTIEDRRTVSLRNISMPIEIVRLVIEDRVAFPVDPVCRMRVDPEDAVTPADGGGTVFFCSQECRDAYRRGRFGPPT